jgi:hypothetical protein
MVRTRIHDYATARLIYKWGYAIVLKLLQRFCFHSMETAIRVRLDGRQVLGAVWTSPGEIANSFTHFLRMFLDQLIYLQATLYRNLLIWVISVICQVPKHA